MYTCPKCGAPLQPGDTSCPQCHTQFGTPVPMYQPTPQRAPFAPRKRDSSQMVIIILLVVLIVAICGVGGYYIWHSSRVAEKPATAPDTIVAVMAQPEAPAVEEAEEVAPVTAVPTPAHASSGSAAEGEHYWIGSVAGSPFTMLTEIYGNKVTGTYSTSTTADMPVSGTITPSAEGYKMTITVYNPNGSRRCRYDGVLKGTAYTGTQESYMNGKTHSFKAKISD